MRNVSTAFHTYVAANEGALPSLRGPLIEHDTDPSNPLRYSSWPVQLLPYIELQGLHDRLLACTADGNRDSNDRDCLEQLSKTSIQVFTCPVSPRAGHPGALCFVVNMGYMTADIWDDAAQGYRHQVSGTYDWNNGPFDEDSLEDAQVSRATGVICHDAFENGPRIDSMSDGQSQTILLAENLNAGWWVSGAPHETGFAVRIGGTSTRIPTAGQSPQGLGGGKQETGLQFHTRDGRATIDLGPSAINANLDSESHSLPRPSSLHPGGVNLFFCDGSGRFVSENIDPSVYARLVSSAGTKFGQGAIKVEDF
jgi:prepilin-type processing-associated H-X9-DG protein